MKRTILFFLTGMIIFSSCSNNAKEEETFDKNLRKSYSELEELIYSSAIVCDKISKTWHDAIYKDRDHKGNYCSDFNDALRTLFRDYAENGTIDKIKYRKEKMEKYASEMKDHPDSRDDCYDDYIEIVSEASSLSRMATDPSGNLQSYNEQTNEAFETISKKIDKFKLKYGDYLKSKWEKDK